MIIVFEQWQYVDGGINESGFGFFLDVMFVCMCVCNDNRISFVEEEDVDRAIEECFSATRRRPNSPATW